jgi:hypothetical protein
MCSTTATSRIQFSASMSPLQAAAFVDIDYGIAGHVHDITDSEHLRFTELHDAVTSRT